MPGPFPGMDPWLEANPLWSGLHQGLIGTMRNVLNTLLPPGYAADIGERVFVVQPGRNVYSDVVVFEQSRPQGTAAGGAAVADAPVVLRVEPVELREVFLEIRPVGKEQRVVTAVELLSPVNKTPGHATRESYLRKQADLLRSDTHLLEIDLQREGEHTVAAPKELLQVQARRWDYLVCLHRAGEGGRFETWPRTVRDPLPRVPILLDPGVPDVILDLQAVFDRNYDDAIYDQRVYYTDPPEIPLAPADGEWADALLRAAGRR